MTDKKIPPHACLTKHGETYSDALRYAQYLAEYATRPVERYDGMAAYTNATQRPEPGTAHVQPALWSSPKGRAEEATPGILIAVYSARDNAVFVPYHALPSLIQHLCDLQADLGEITGLVPEQAKDQATKEAHGRYKGDVQETYRAAAEAGTLVDFNGKPIQ